MNLYQQCKHADEMIAKSGPGVFVPDALPKNRIKVSAGIHGTEIKMIGPDGKEMEKLPDGSYLLEFQREGEAKFTLNPVVMVPTTPVTEVYIKKGSVPAYRAPLPTHKQDMTTDYSFAVTLKPLEPDAQP